MKSLIYSVEPKDKNRRLDTFEDDLDGEVASIMSILNEMSLSRVLEKGSVSLLVDNISSIEQTDTVTADIYKIANPGGALHQFEEEGDGVTVQEILSEQEDAFQKGVLGMTKTESGVKMAIQKNYGSYFVNSSFGMDIRSEYSSDAIKAIKRSDTIGKTEFEFSDAYNPTASLFEPPKDRDVREHEGLGMSDTLNKIMSVSNISNSHRLSIDIKKNEWMNNVENMEKIVESDIVSIIRVSTDTDGIVKIGDGGDRAIRESVQISDNGTSGIKEVLRNYDD
jgi:hypothetical protein